MTHGSLTDYTLPAPAPADDDGVPRAVALIGSTGSIGTQGLDVIAQDPARLRAVALAGGANTTLLAEQAVRFEVEAVGSAAAGEEELRAALADAAARLGRPAPRPVLFTGPRAAEQIAAWPGADTVLNGITGSIGLRPTLAALHAGLELGMTLVDTAEMYADGGAEEVVGEALAGRRDEAFVVSKVMPSHASRSGTIAACERSLKRLGTDRIDLYLLHWQGRYPLEDTVAAFHQLVEDGKIRYWGVSNFDHRALAELQDVPGSSGLATDQVLYNLSRRGPEYDLLPWCADHQLPVMAYSPIEQGRILHDTTLNDVAARHSVSPAAAALAWVLRRDSLCTIPKASSPQHVRDNATALDVELTREDLDALDRAFPPPSGPRPLEML